MEKILNFYYANNAGRLRLMVDRILLKFGGLSDKDRDDFYSLANEVFADVWKKYDDSQSFDGFLYTCLSNRIKTEMTKRNSHKRKIDRISVSIDMPVGEDESCSLADTIAGSFDLEQKVFGEEDRSERLEQYLNRLSRVQRRVIELAAASYGAGEIQKILHMTQKEYLDAMAGIRSYENVVLLF